MKTFDKALIVAALAVLISSLSASVNAQVVVTIHQPPPEQLNVEHLWNFSLTNNTQETYKVYLRGTATKEREGLIFEGISQTFTLPADFVGRVSLLEISPIDVKYSKKEYEDVVLKTGSVPEGFYTVCIYLINAENGEELAQDCIRQQVAHPSPPQLISPADGATVEDEFPVFAWMPPMPLPQEVSYDLKIVEILAGQSPVDAMQSNPAWFEEKGIPTTSFRYPIGARAFKQGKTYCWQVTPWIGDWKVGSSEVWSFKAGPQPPEEAVSLELISPKDGEEIDTPTPRFEWRLTDTLVGIATLEFTPTVYYNLRIWQLPEGLAERVAEGYRLTEEDLVNIEPYSVDFVADIKYEARPSPYLKEGYIDKVLELENEYKAKYNKLKKEYEEELEKLYKEFEKKFKDKEKFKEEYKDDIKFWGEEEAWEMYLEDLRDKLIERIKDLNRKYNQKLRDLTRNFYFDFLKLEEEYLPQYKAYFLRQLFGYPDNLLYIPPPPGYEYLEDDYVLLSMVEYYHDEMTVIWTQVYEELVERVAEGYRLTEEDLVDIEPYFVEEGIEGTYFDYPEDADYPLVPGFSYYWQVQAVELSGSPVGENNGRSEIRSFTCAEIAGQERTCIDSTWKFENIQPMGDDCKTFDFFAAKSWHCVNGKWVDMMPNYVIQAKKVERLPDDAQYCNWYTIRKEDKKGNIIYNTYHRGRKYWDTPVEIKVPKVGVEDDLNKPCKDCDRRFEILGKPPEEKDNEVKVKCKKWHCKNGEFVFEGEEYEEFEIVTKLPDKWRHCQKVVVIDKKPGKRIYTFYHCDHGTWEKIKVIETPENYIHIFGMRGAGKARVMFPGEKKWRKAEKCMKLPVGSRIETWPGVKLYIKIMVEGKRVGTARVGPLTQMKVKKFVREKEKVKTKLNLKIGTVRVKVEKTQLRTDFQVSTPSIIAGVKGTSFEVSYNDTTNTSVVDVFEGSASVTNLKTNETVVITGYGNGTGQRATVQGDKIIVDDITGMDASPGGEWDFDAMFEK